MQADTKLCFPTGSGLNTLTTANPSITIFELIVKQTGNLAKKYLHISLYRMESGNYELNHYIA
jgi:hypothetical protein